MKLMTGINIASMDTSNPGASEKLVTVITFFFFMKTSITFTHKYLFIKYFWEIPAMDISIS